MDKLAVLHSSKQFPQDKLAMAVDGSWAGSTWAENGAAQIATLKEIRLCAIPDTKWGRTWSNYDVWRTGWYLPAQAKNKEELGNLSSSDRIRRMRLRAS